MSAAGARRTLAEVEAAEVARALAGDGLWIDVGAATIRTRSDSRPFATQLRSVYGQFPYVDRADWADLHVDLRGPTGFRRWIKPQVVFHCDGQRPFDPFPSSAPLPLYEWGCNWLIGRRLNDLLLLHAGALERDGLALLLPALPGSGKSTLTAALSQRGWRLLSDELTLIRLDTGQIMGLARPVNLKNASIDIIRAYAPDAFLTRPVHDTTKGTVAMMAPPEAIR